MRGATAAPTETRATTRAMALGAAGRLLQEAGIDTPKLDARLLMQHVLGARREALLAARDLPLGAAEARRLAALVRRRAAREPLAYLTGRREFWSLDLAVDRSALVPRPETETVVEAVLAHDPRLPARARLLDLGTGSGCLLVALLGELGSAAGLGVDISAAAVSLARANAGRNGVGGRASFIVADWGAAARRTIRHRGEQPALCRGLRPRLARAGDRPPRAAGGARRRGGRLCVLPATRAADRAPPGAGGDGRARARRRDGGCGGGVVSRRRTG